MIHFVSGQAVLTNNRYQDEPLTPTKPQLACDDEEYSLVGGGGSHGFIDDDDVD